MNEFDVIAKYFRPLTMGRAEAADLRDDGAALNVPPGHDLVVTSDTLNAGTHFFESENPVYIAHRALRSNLSDLAAMGAKPYAYQLCVAFPEKPSEDWLAAFTGALLKDQEEFGIFCSGGDTTSIKGPLSVTITAFGIVPSGKEIRREGARDGDVIILTGPVGDAWIGLQCLQEGAPAPDESFITAYRKPKPRTAIVDILQQYAHAAIDISDGLVADLNHICAASDFGAMLKLENIKFSPAAQGLIDAGALTPQSLLTGGDDYELLFTVSRAQEAEVLAALTARGLAPQAIGYMSSSLFGVRIQDKNGVSVAVGSPGWTHF